jgi:hypothetical protein
MSTPNVGYGFVPCLHDDPKCSHYLVSGEWYDISGRVCNCTVCHDFPTRKPAEIPDGWELVPEGEPVPADHQWINTGTYRWSHCGCGYETFAKAMEDTYGSIPMGAFIRRKSVQPTVEPSKPAVDWSKPLQLKDGRKARFLALIKCPEQPRCCVVTDADGDEWVEAWCENGNYTVPGLSPLDIINTPERIERDVWLTLYRSGDISTDETEEAAKANRDKDRVACVRVQIDCNVGEGL